MMRDALRQYLCGLLSLALVVSSRRVRDERRGRRRNGDGDGDSGAAAE